MTARQVLRSEDFIDAVQADLQRLREVDRAEWFDLLARDIADLEQLISAFPQAGKLVATRAGRELRKKVLRRTPFVLFYDFEPGRRSGPVRLIWLVHQHARAARRIHW